MDDSGSFFFIFIMVFVTMMLLFSLDETGPYETRGECLRQFTVCVAVDDGWDAGEGAEPRD